MNEAIINLRRQLHQNPDLSGQESKTAELIRDFIERHYNTRIITGLGGNGLAVVYEFSGDGPVVMVRCELDALPIEEANAFQHRSAKPGISHKCGHDGHMAIVSGLIFWIKQQSFKRGKIILLFQPAEETGKGAYAVLNDPRFETLKPDYIFALHNLPGEPLNEIITVKGNFSATVQSVAFYLQGKQSHASEPENGINPALAIAEIIAQFSKLIIADVSRADFALLTPVHINMGSKDYGISAGYGELHYTMRTWGVNEMEELKARIQAIVEEVCRKHSLQYATGWFDYFPATVNDDSCVDLIIKAAETNGFTVRNKPHSFKFGEDFGWFSQHHKAAMFGLGSGINMPALHHADYDFPDEILETGIRMFSQIIAQILGSTTDDPGT